MTIEFHKFRTRVPGKPSRRHHGRISAKKALGANEDIQSGKLAEPPVSRIARLLCRIKSCRGASVLVVRPSVTGGGRELRQAL